MNFTDHYIQWSLLLLCLVGLAYTAIIIKQEKDSAFVHGHDFEFKGIKFRVPTWWTQKNNEHGLCFHRADTHYDWRSNITWNKTPDDFNQFTIDWFANKEIILDETGQMEDMLPHLFRSQEFQEEITRARRIEGSGTQSIEKRIYLDVVFIQLKTGLVVAESLSSVLNGSLEGPFFEEMVYNFELSKK